MPRPVFLLDQPHLVRRRFSQKSISNNFFIARRKFVNSLVECNFAAVVKCIMVKKFNKNNTLLKVGFLSTVQFSLASSLQILTDQADELI